VQNVQLMARISAFNRSCERKQSHIYPSKSLKKVAISFDHDPILFIYCESSVFGRHRYPWGDEAIGKARKENKPIFLSIGYSTCYWCHGRADDLFQSRHRHADEPVVHQNQTEKNVGN
jgi:Protein of unknown function, DUF255